MGEFKDFDISYCGWTKGNWDLNYKGESKDMVIPKELIDGCDKEVACVRISSSTDDIESIYLPENVPDVWLGTLFNSRCIKEINVSPDSKYLKSIDGVLFSKDGKRLIKFPAVKAGEYTVPDGVEKIENIAFSNAAIEKINFPDSLTEISDYAFQNSQIKSAKIPAGVKEIDDNVFMNASKLEEFEFLGDTKVNYMYMDMASEMESRISGEAFFPISSAYTLACLKKYPDIDKCRRKFIAAAKRGKNDKILEYLLSTEPETYEQSGSFETTELADGTLEIKKYEGNEKTVNIPADIDGKKVTSVGAEAFDKNEYIEKVIIPDGVAKIGKNAFRECISLDEVIIPESCTEIGRGAFNGCKSLRKADLPKGITEIQSRTFCDCVSLESLILPDGLVKIDDEALKSCESLNDLTLPDGLKYLGKECLYGCGFNHGPVPEGGWGYGLKEFYIPASVTQISGRGDGLFARYPKAQELFGVFEPKMMLKVVRGSVAHRYASKMKIRFEFV